MTTDSIEPQPRTIGFCLGVPGQPCGRRILDNEVEAVELEPHRFNQETAGSDRQVLLLETNWGETLE